MRSQIAIVRAFQFFARSVVRFRSVRRVGGFDGSPLVRDAALMRRFGGNTLIGGNTMSRSANREDVRLSTR